MRNRPCLGERAMGHGQRRVRDRGHCKGSCSELLVVCGMWQGASLAAWAAPGASF